MGLTVTRSPDGKIITLAIQGQFQFALHREFRDAYLGVTQPGCEFDVNLAATDYMDSSALGMLLLLKEHANQYGSRVVLVSPSSAIRRVLEIASFEQLFAIKS
ncbi:STAS domain-containing protein [Uliginosibacterium aquaticum]|uniref:STAS domain-containing protein n=1 Tax=Uliginosibacterium aquaticum TaxID=2731212 RepID=A0ABX2IHV8_9RHOO|nr:STAS domain-containing protein [Uliginosibacterium aquaticum]NSL56404.1 STAS domain-containing protein [Uliginosibacterium aquaticum]